MVEDPVAERKRILKELQDRKTVFSQAEEDARRAASIAAGDAFEFQKLAKKADFWSGVYSDTPESELQKMTSAESSEYFQSASQYIGSTAPAVPIAESYGGALPQQIMAASIVTSTTSGTGDAAIHFTTAKISHPEWYPNGDQIVRRYESDNQFEEDIAYLKTELPTVSLDVAKDFEEVLANYYGSTNRESKYVTLIGARSALFWKLIFTFAESTYGATRGTPKRKIQIEQFVYGSNTPLPALDPLLQFAFDLWNEMSDQDTPGANIKKGDAGALYLEDLFARLIGVIASLIKLRKTHLSP